VKQSEIYAREQMKACHVALEKHRAFCQEAHEAPMKSHSNKVLELQEKASEGSKLAEIYRYQLSKFEQEHLRRQDALRKELDETATTRAALEKERLNIQSKAKFDSTRHKSKSDDPDAHLMSLLKCSTCNINFRDTVLTKCSHTFCRSCLDARITSRQRKCPACGTGFGQSECIKIFMQ